MNEILNKIIAFCLPFLCGMSLVIAVELLGIITFLLRQLK